MKITIDSDLTYEESVQLIHKNKHMITEPHVTVDFSDNLNFVHSCIIGWLMDSKRIMSSRGNILEVRLTGCLDILGDLNKILGRCQDETCKNV